jgi:hypothetical protein
VVDLASNLIIVGTPALCLPHSLASTAFTEFAAVMLCLCCAGFQSSGSVTWASGITTSALGLSREMLTVKFTVALSPV